MAASRRHTSRPKLEALETRCVLDAAIRTIDGTGNNLSHPEWGSTDEPFLRAAPAAYADGNSAPAGADRPSAREVSNVLAAHSPAATPDGRGLTPYVYLWGQFIDHDIDLTAGGGESFPIAVPAGDPWFDPAGTGTVTIPFTRSAAVNGQQINQITAWIDGSMVYGSDEETAAALRTFSGGRLKVTESDVGDLPPLEDGSYQVGDVRANENISLTSMHTVFLREHNRLADGIAAADPSLSDEEVYQRARALVIAEIQVITYKEWLPALIGATALPAYRGYNPNVNPSIANEFATAAFRLHTTINDDVGFFDGEGNPMAFTVTGRSGQEEQINGEIGLADAFFNPGLFGQTGVDGVLKYAASTHAERADTQLVDSLRNFLFGPPGAGGLDLAALNVQRGRDHGLADYNTARAAYGLPRVTGFAQVTPDRALQQKLQALYGTVNNIDLWAGAMAEGHAPGASVGPLAQRIIADQFRRLRDGDRFWYQRAFSGTQLAQLERTTLADVIRRNTGVTNLQRNVFFFKAEVQGQVFADGNGNGRLDRGERGAAGVQVRLLNGDGEVLATATTDAAGRYFFRGLPETGAYRVEVVPPAGSAVTTPEVRDVQMTRGDEAVRGQDFGLRRVTPPRATAARDAAFADLGRALAALNAPTENGRRL